MNEGNDGVLRYPPGKRNHPYGQKESEGICRMRMKMIQRLLLLTTASWPFDGGKYIMSTLKKVRTSTVSKYKWLLESLTRDIFAYVYPNSGQIFD